MKQPLSFTSVCPAPPQNMLIIQNTVAFSINTMFSVKDDWLSGLSVVVMASSVSVVSRKGSHLGFSLGLGWCRWGDGGLLPSSWKKDFV